MERYRDVDLLASAEHEASFFRERLLPNRLLVLHNLKIETMVEFLPAEHPARNNEGGGPFSRL